MRSPLLLGQTIRNVGRAREIFQVLVRYGFADVMRELGLTRVAEFGTRLFRNQAAVDELQLPQPVRLRKAMEELGPTFVKLGQVLSMRPDLVPVAWATEFRKLQDQVPPVEFAEIRERLDTEFPAGTDELFESIDEEPLAAASVAQVHRARLKSGERVVIKVLRPGIHETIRSDMEILHWLAGYAEEHFQNLGYSPTEVIEQFSRELRRETDLRREGRNCDRLRAAHKDNPNVHVPIVHWQSTTRNVLTMEEIDGTLLSRLDKDQVSKQDLERIVANGADAVFHQCLEVGFFHADPHPGNIVAQAEGKICFIDCGMTGHIDPKTARQLADLVQGTISGDVDRVVDVIITFGDADPALASDRAFRADVWDFISRFDDATFADLDMGALLNDFFEKIRAHGLRCPADIVFLIKAITTIEGVGEQLAPDFPLVDYVQPYVERLVRQHYGIGALRRRLQGTIADYTQMLEELPAHARSLVYDLRRNQLTINLEHHGLKELSETIDRSTGNVANAVFVAALIMGSSILVLADSTSDGHGWLSVVAGIGFFVALIIIFLRVVITRFR